MDLGLKGKVFVVTGGSRGLGLTTATVLVAEARASTDVMVAVDGGSTRAL